MKRWRVLAAGLFAVAVCAVAALLIVGRDGGSAKKAAPTLRTEGYCVEDASGAAYTFWDSSGYGSISTMHAAGSCPPWAGRGRAAAEALQAEYGSCAQDTSFGETKHFTFRAGREWMSPESPGPCPTLPKR